jgi:putative endonuclease
MLSSKTGTLYVGITGYFDRRIMQHKMDTIEGFTKKYQVHRLVYYETPSPADENRVCRGPRSSTMPQKR